MRLWVLIVLLACTPLSHAQTTEAGPPAEASKLTTLRALVDSMTSLRKDLAEANLKAKSGANDTEKAEAKKDSEDLQKRLDEAERDFESVATGVSDDDDDQPSATKFDLAAELNDLLGPLVQDLKKATAQPREIDRLRDDLSRQQKRLDHAREAVSGLNSLMASLPRGAAETALRKELLSVQSDWKDTVVDAESGVSTAGFKLNEAIHNRKSIWEILSHTAETFFLKRGINILLAIAAFFLTFMGWRALHPLFVRFTPLRTGVAQRPFAMRALDVVFQSLAVIVSIIAALLVLYVQGDWLLLSLGLISVIALLLAAKNGLPKYYSQARLLLNLGEVREGERVLINGLPWQVKSINMFTDLVNPALRNGHLRLPIAQVAGMGSRPSGNGEPWFPCKEDDWVLLGDGTFGKAVCLTPEYVQLVQLGGAFKTYTTQRFIAENPTTFAKGFRVSAIVKVHPEHRADALKAIPEALRATIEKGLPTIIEGEHVRSVQVEFRAVIPAALEFDVVADFDGEVAEKYPTLQRAVQRFTLQALNANNWKLGG